jgi:hypothetical protein
VRIRHAELEDVRANPTAWAAAKLDPRSQFMRSGFAQANRMAIYYFHKTADANAAQRYLVDLMDRLNLRNLARRSAAEFELQGYLEWFRRENPVVVARKLRVELDIGAGQLLCGEVPRVDLDLRTEGYRAILLGDVSPNWRDELRMPLLQRAVANRIARDESTVAIGVQMLDGGGLDTVRYSARQVQSAMRRVNDIASQVAQRLGSQNR